MKFSKARLYLYLCISAFFLVLAVTLFYSFGYIYDFQTGESYQTGAIVLKAAPKDAVITKDGEVVEQSGLFNGLFSTFVKIENLATGKSYDIKVNKDGYNEWQKNVAVSAGQVGKYESIVLLRQSYEDVPVLPATALPDKKDVWFSPQTNQLIFQGVVGLESGLFLADFNAEEQSLLLDKSQLGLMGEVESVRWSEDGGRIFLGTSLGSYIVELGGEHEAFLIAAGVGKTLKQNAFFVNDKYVVFIQSGIVFSYDFSTRATKRLADIGTSNFDVNQGTVYFFKESSGSAVLYSVSVADPALAAEVGTLGAGFDMSRPFTAEQDGGNTLLLSGRTLYLINREGAAKRLNSDVSNADFSKGGKRIVYYNDQEIWVYYIESKTSQPVKTAGENELLARFSGKLSNINVYLDEEHVFFQVDNTLYFTELDGRDWRNTYKLLDNPDGQDVFYVRSSNSMYFIAGDRMFKKELAED